MLVRGEKGTAKSTIVRALAAVLPPIEVVAGLPVLLRPGRPRRRAARTVRTHDGPRQTPAGPAGRAAGRRHRGPGARLAAPRAGAGRRDVTEYEPGLLAARAPRHPLRRRGQPAARPPRRPAARRRRDGPLDRRARRRLGRARRPVRAGRHDEPRGGRAAAAAARPVRAHRRGRRARATRPLRVEVVRRRLAFDADPDAFAASYADAERGARPSGSLAAAGAAAAGPARPTSALLKIAEVCAAFEVDGMRADIVTARAAVAHAAWHGRDRRDPRGHPRRRPARAAPPAPAQPVRRARPRRGPARPDPRRRRAGPRAGS